jgi:hypothetical protein
MCPKLLLFFSKRCFFLTPHSSAAEDHHNRLVSSLLPVRRTAGHSLILFAFMRTILFPPFPSFLNRSHALSVVGFGFLTRTKDVVLRNKCVLLLFGTSVLSVKPPILRVCVWLCCRLLIAQLWLLPGYVARSARQNRLVSGSSGPVSSPRRN